MNFFERQAAARQASFRLVLLFALAVSGIVLVVDFVVWVVIAANDTATPGQTFAALALVSLLVLGAIGLASLHRIASLRGGGDVLARQMGGVPVPAQTTDPQLRRLRGVVEEIAIAACVPMPGLYVLEQESAINAFIAGHAPADAAIAITRGALERLNRDELQGVIAHEFSHLLDGDMRLNLRLIGVLSGILMPALVGRRILDHGRSSSRDWRRVLVLAAGGASMALGALGLLFGRMIKAGASRSRERLADASAAQSIGQTAGLSGALKKIACVVGGATLSQRADAEEVGHMLFGDGVGLDGLFATHPSPLQRIRALEPTFDATQLAGLQRRWAAEPPEGLAEDVRLRRRESSSLPAVDAVLAISPAMIVAQVAHPGEEDFRRADAIVAAMPAAVRALAADRDSVVPLVIALLLDADPAVRARQHTEIAARLGRQAAVHAQALRDEHIVSLHPLLRLPLAALAFPVLGHRPRVAIGLVLDTVHAAVNTDGRVSLFEYGLGTLLQTQMHAALDPTRHAPYGRRRAADARAQVATLLATIARATHGDAHEGLRAYLAGLQRIFPDVHIDYAPPANGVLALEDVWPALDALVPMDKQRLVEAIAVAVGRDGRVSVVEGELLRTLCALLHCPLPPVLERR